VRDHFVEIEGRVTQILSDDKIGSRHQRFIIRLDDDSTRLIVHNIDVAPRVPITVGDRVRVRGALVESPQGGVLHRTHLDPQGDDPDGWVEHHKRRYE
jgi:hypothetical protein